MWTKTKYCSVECRPKRIAKPVKVSVPPQDMRSPLRRAYEDEDWDAVLEAIRFNCRMLEGCWVWQRQSKEGYAVGRIGRKSVQMHRVALEAKHGASLGTQAAHHVCANTLCVNPEHLQPVTAAQNTAEMLARSAYLARIRDLEDALAFLDPNNALLQHIPLY